MLLYFSISYVGILHHELWLDEAHHWLMARDSQSISELFKTTRPDGHPVLWSIMLYGITCFTNNPFWMQLLHITIATATVFIFLRKAPFSWDFKILFIFGYFMIFEYDLISRNYILGIFFLFLACSVFKERQYKFILLSIYLALAANVHLMFSTIALALMLTLMYENYLQKRFFNRQYVIGYLIFGIGAGTLWFQLATTDSTWFFNMLGDISLTERISKGFIALLKGLLAIPDFRTLHFWNSNILVNWNRSMAAVLGLLLYALPLLLFFKNKKMLFFVYTALIGTQIFFWITQRSATRFHGMTYIIIIMALWLEYYYNSEDSKLKRFLYRFKLTLFKNPIIYGILIIHLCSGIMAYATDYIYPFMSGKATVNFLKNKNLQDIPVISLTCDGTCLSPYLEKKVWFLCDGSYQSYCHWDFLCAVNIRRDEVIRLVSDFMSTHNRAIYASYFPLVNKPQQNIWIKLNTNVKVRFLKSFGHDSSVVKDNYFIYEVKK